MRRDSIDFHEVQPQHIAIHEKLEQWARWVRVRPHGWATSPMFKQYRPANPTEGWWDRREPKPQTNVLEAAEMEKAVSALPEKHREAIRWSYYWATVHPLVAKANGWPHGPMAMARKLAVSKEGLMDLVRNGRQMLINRCG